jgi:hypothetical protein
MVHDMSKSITNLSIDFLRLPSCAIFCTIIMAITSNAEIHPGLKVYLFLLEAQAATALIYFLSRKLKRGRQFQR